MMDKHHDCCPSCSSTGHLDQLTAATTKGTAAQLVSLLPRCFNHLKGKDSFDRTLMHIASSCGRCLVLRWLLRRRGAPINEPDGESGWTPLHRAIYYGQLSCARLLLSNGASFSSPRDFEGLTPMDVLAYDRYPHVILTASDPMEVFTWGSNLNYTLGHPTNQSKETPDCVESLRKASVAVTSVHLGKFHSAFLSVDGSVFLCGYGQGGRLGLGKADNLSCLVPRKIESLEKEKCIEVAIGQDHTMFLTENASLFGCGSNAKGQLGLTKSPGGNAPPPMCSEPKSVALKFLKGEKIAKIACGKEYSVVIGGKFSLFGCGVNHGQFGFLSPLKTSSTDGTVTSQLAEAAINLDTGFVWLKVSDLISKEKSCEIVDVVCAESAMVVSTKRGDIYLLANHKLRKIETPKYFAPELIRLSANKSLDNSGYANVAGVSFHLLVLTMTGKLFSWRSGDPNMRRCLFKESLGGREIYLVDVCLSRQGFICVAENGFAYSGTFAAGKPKEVKSTKEAKVKKEENRGKKEEKKSPTPPFLPPSSRGKNSSSSLSIDAYSVSTSASPGFSHPMVPFLNPDECQRVIVKRIPFVTRAVKCVADAKGENFAVLQTHPANGVTQIVDLVASEMTPHFRSFFTDSCSSFSSDVTSDVTIKVANRRFNAHKFILASRSEYFRKLFEKENDSISTKETEVGDVENDDSEPEEACSVDSDASFDDDDDDDETYNSDDTSFFDLDTFVGGDPILFSHILEFLYTDSCDFLRDGKKIPPLKKVEKKSADEELFNIDDLTKSAFSVLNGGASGGKKGQQKGSKKKGGGGGGVGSGKNNANNPLEAMKTLTKKFGLKPLSKQLDAVFLEEGGIVRQMKHKTVNPPKLRFERTKHKWAYDVILKSEDGVCYPCHRCVLVARLEFFSAMFSSGWLETTTTTESKSGKRQPKQALPMPFNADVLEVLLRFIYADDAPALNDPDRGDLCFHVLVAADQLLIPRLKSLCEVAIADHVMTLKNGAEVLQFAVTYNATGLRDRAAQFLCLNIATLLERKALDGLSHEAMDHLTQAYQSSHPSISYRRLTPHHVDLDLSRFDASGKKDFASLLEEEDDLKVEEISEDEEVEEGGNKGGKGKGNSSSAKKKRERKVSWNDGGITRDRKSSTGDSTSLGPGTLLSSKLKGAKLRTTSIGEEMTEDDVLKSPVQRYPSDARSPSPMSSPPTAVFPQKVGTGDSQSSSVGSGPTPISKSFFDSYLSTVEKKTMSSLRSVIDEENRKSKGERKIDYVQKRDAGGAAATSGTSAIKSNGCQPTLKLSWASKSSDSKEISPEKEILSTSLGKSFKELMIEDSRKGGGGGVGVERSRTYSTASVDEERGGGDRGEQHSNKSSKRKISFGLMGDHQQPRTSKGKSKSRETVEEDKPLSVTPSNPWTNFQTINESGVDGSNGPVNGGLGSSPDGKSPRDRKLSHGDSFVRDHGTSGSTSGGIPGGAAATSGATVSLSRVIHEEAEAKVRWKRETQKSLQLIQIEEQALKELKNHYEMIFGRDGEEIIHVERAVEDYVWQPLWKKSGDVH